MPQCKKNPLKVNETKFLSLSLEKGRYVKRYYFSNGLGASVVCHSGSYGGNEGLFELAAREQVRVAARVGSHRTRRGARRADLGGALASR